MMRSLGCRLALSIVAAAAAAACSDDEPAAPSPPACENLESTFKSDVHRVLTQRCATCHNDRGLARRTRLIVSTESQTPTLNVVSSLVREERNQASLLLGKVVGENGHGGGAVLTRESEDFKTLSRFAEMLSGKCEGPPTKSDGARLNQRFLRKLTPDEYESTLVDLVGMPGFGKTLPPESRAKVFDNVADGMRTDTEYFQQVLANAFAIAESPALDLGSLGAACTTADETCARTAIDAFGARAFRRPLGDEDRERYLGLYRTIGAGNHDRGLRAVVRGMLGSPHFLFRTELGASGANGSTKELTPWEIASELSYLFWGTMPDAALFEAARSGRLATREGVLAEAERLLADGRSAVAQERFVSQWLNLPLLADKAKDPAIYPTFDRETQRDLRDETVAFFVETVRDPSESGSLRTLLTAGHGYLSERGAAFYGVPWVGPDAANGRKKVALPGRSGFLTNGSILALGATASAPVAILRGKLVRTRLLCQELGAPPPTAASVTASLPPPKDNRERAAQLLGNPDCASCHQKMDPIGLGYEGFDAIGRPTGIADTSGEILFAETAAGPFVGPSELHEKLANSAEVRECFGKLWLTHAYGIAASDESAALARTLAAGKPRIGALLLALTQTDHFLRRRADAD